MNETEAIVARVEGDDAWLELCKPTDCEQCGSASGCGLGHGSRPLQRIRNTIGARVGDRVVVSVASGAVLKAAFYSYLMPLLLGLVGAALGGAIAGDLAALSGLVAGLLVGTIFLRRMNHRLAGGVEPMLAMRIKPPIVQFHRNRET